MHPTIAVIIGVSYYCHKFLKSLPAAEADAINFARAICHWGVPEANIILLLNSEAQKEKIENILSGLSQRKEPFKCIFYFCGHGFRDAGEIPESYLLFHDSEVKTNQDKCVNGLSLDSLIKTIGSFNTSENYIFIDACHLRVNSIINPRLKEELSGEKKSRKSLLCILSSGIEESFEDTSNRYGYFTQALLNSYRQIRQQDCSPTQLLNLICEEMEKEGVPLPEMYNIGNQKISFSSSLSSSYLKQHPISRPTSLALIQDAIIQNSFKQLCFIGDKGIGKSTIFQHLASDKLKIIYISIPSSLSIASNPIRYIEECIKNKLNSICNDFPSNSQLTSNDFHYYWVIIDHLERLNPKQINSLLMFSLKTKAKIIFILNQSLKTIADKEFHDFLCEVELPTISYEEGSLFIKTQNPNFSEEECELIYIASRGNFLKMKQLALSHLITKPSLTSCVFTKEIKEAITAICSCEMYINEGLFIKIFRLSENALDFLKKANLLLAQSNGWAGHKLLYTIAATEHLELDLGLALLYWHHQFEEFPENTQVAKLFILAARLSGFENEYDLSLKNAFQTLYNKEPEDEIYLLDGVEIFLNFSQLTEAALFLIQILMDRGKFQLANQLINLPCHQTELLPELKLAMVENLWRTGYFSESILICSKLLKETKKPFFIKCYFFRAISYFLGGNWDEAGRDFTYIYEHSQENHYKWRAQCMLGTIIGLQGADLQKGKKLIEAGIHILFQMGDLSGAWCGWNNLGEILWKCGDYQFALSCLEKALEITTHLHDRVAKFETIRNLLQLYLRMSGPFSRQVSSLLTDLEKNDWDKCEPIDQLQLLNTLTTVYIFRHDIRQALSFLKRAVLLAKSNKRPDIYTLSNLSCLWKLLGLEEKANHYFFKALELAKKEGNRLAMHQLRNDYTFCLNKTG